MSSLIAVSSDIDGGKLQRTLKECEESNWVVSESVVSGFDQVKITNDGRQVVTRSRPLRMDR